MGGFTDTLLAKATFDEQFEAACYSRRQTVTTGLGRSATYIFKKAGRRNVHPVRAIGVIFPRKSRVSGS